MFVALLIVTIAVIVISGRKAQQEIGTNPTEQQSDEEQNSDDEDGIKKEIMSLIVVRTARLAVKSMKMTKIK